MKPAYTLGHVDLSILQELMLRALQVYWMYWPDDLPKCKEGRGASVTGGRYYHGESEMIASNHMDVINVCTFAGIATVRHWDESDDEEIQPGLFWRQTLDYHTAELSVSHAPNIVYFTSISY